MFTISNALNSALQNSPMPLGLLHLPARPEDEHVLYYYTDSGYRRVRLPTALKHKNLNLLSDPADLYAWHVYRTCQHYSRLYNQQLMTHAPPIMYIHSNLRRAYDRQGYSRFQPHTARRTSVPTESTNSENQDTEHENEDT